MSAFRYLRLKVTTLANREEVFIRLAEQCCLVVTSVVDLIRQLSAQGEALSTL